MVAKVEYQILEKRNDIEIRKYPRLLLATVYGEEESSAFNILFRYISGDNKSGEAIEMTAPVVSSLRTKSGSPRATSGGFFTFVMPGKYDLGNLPRSDDARISFHVQDEKKFAVLRFRGTASEKNLRSRQDELLESVLKHGYRTKGDSFLMRYNSPFMPGPFRTNEMGIEVI